jgi:hypothetical protein
VLRLPSLVLLLLFNSRLLLLLHHSDSGAVVHSSGSCLLLLVAAASRWPCSVSARHSALSASRLEPACCAQAAALPLPLGGSSTVLVGSGV